MTYNEHAKIYDGMANRQLKMCFEMPIFYPGVDDLIPHIDGLEQERRNSIASALKLRLSCTYPLICQ